MKSKIVRRIILSICCCLLCCGFACLNLKAASSTTVSGIYCFSERTNNYTTFDAATTPNGSGYGGTYKLVSTGTYATTLGANPTKTYTVTGAAEARITNKALPVSSATKWTKVSSTHHYLVPGETAYDYLTTTSH